MEFYLSKLFLCTCPSALNPHSESTIPGKMATGTFNHNSLCMKILKTLLRIYRKVLKTSNLAYAMLVQGRILPKNVGFLCAYWLGKVRKI